MASYALPGTRKGQNALCVYLCSMTEDADLRSNEKEYERIGDAWLSIQPPLRLKCTYIVSAWSDKPNPEDAALMEIRLLSRAFAVFASSTSIPAAYLPSPLKAAGLPKPIVVPVDNDLAKQPDFWSLVGSAFRPSFSLSATVSIPVEEVHFDHVVEDLQIKYINGLVERNS